MHDARLWLWGLIPLLALWVLASAATGPAIKTDLALRASERMAQQGQPWAKVEIAGRDARIATAAPTASAKVAAIAAAIDTTGIRRVSGEGEVLPPRNPYTWSAQRSAEAITLGGYVPDDAARNQIRAMAERIMSGNAVSSQMELGDGEPRDFAAVVEYALTQLSRLAEGDAALSNTALTISGRAATREGYNAFTGALGSLPQGFTLSSANVIPPRHSPYLFSAERSAGIVLNGFAPDEATRAQIIALAGRLFPGVAVMARLELAEGAPAGFAALAGYALEQLAHLADGSVALSDATLSIKGRAKTVADHAAFADAIKGLPPGGRLGAAEVSPALVSPYVWSVEKNAGGIVVRGAVPDNSMRQANLAAAKRLAPDRALRDEQFLAAGAPAAYAGAVDSAMDAINRLEEGIGEIRDTSLRIAGKAVTQEVREQIRTALQGAKLVGIAVVTDSITAPQPSRIPDPPEPPPLSADLLPPAPPQPPPTPEVQTAQIPEPPPPPPLAQELLPPPVPPSPPPAAARAPAEIVVRAPEPANVAAQDCKEKVTTAVASRSVMFGRSRAELSADSRTLVQAIADALKDCGSLTVSIEGHADIEGEAFNNQRLSEARAAAVAAALKGAGVDDAKLSSTGFGTSRPRAPNTTVENKAKNRRVEFIIR